MALTLMYITNNSQVALIAEQNSVERIWIDLEYKGKEERQKGLNTVKSHHSISDIQKIKPLLAKSELLVRVNPWNAGSENEIDQVIEAGADLIMLPMWKTSEEVKDFLRAVDGRCKTILLLETKEAEACLDNVLEECKGIDEIHIGLNDLHLSYGLNFMFELLTNGVVERICEKIKAYGIPYGFGGIARLGAGELPAEKIIMEHYRLGSTRAILSRSFCNTDEVKDLKEIEEAFNLNMDKLRTYEKSIEEKESSELWKNHLEVTGIVERIVESRKG